MNAAAARRNSAPDRGAERLSNAGGAEVMICEHCKQEITQSPAPIINIGPDSVVHFCCWECLAMWANKRAGEILMPDLDNPFFGSDGPQNKWG